MIGPGVWLSSWTGSGATAQRLALDQASGVVSVVPEPSAYAVALAGMACGGYSLWRRRKRN